MAQEGSYYYEPISSPLGVRITAYAGPGGAVTIPSTLGGLNVVQLDQYSFYNNSTITSVIIPDTVVNIMDRSFEYSGNITSITVGAGVTSIGYRAFAHCYALNNIYFKGATVPSIASGWIYQVPGTSRAHAYEGTSFPLPGEYLNGILMGDYILEYTYYNSDGCSIITEYTGINTHVVLPIQLGGYNVSLISANTFDTPTGHLVTDITLNSGSMSFQGSPCIGAYSLVNINADTNNDNYSSVDGVLFNKEGLVLERFPEGKGGAYTISSGITSLANGAFSNCTLLTSIEIPDSLDMSDGTDEYYWYFYDCTALESFVVSTGNPSYSSLDGVLYNKLKTTLYQYPSGKSGVEFVVPDTVTTMYNDCISGYQATTSLERLVLSDSVTTIQSYMCDNMGSLTSVVIGSAVSYIEDYFIDTCPLVASVTFGGLIAPTLEGGQLVRNPSPDLLGHAHDTSNFPPPGDSLGNMLMGAYIEQPPKAPSMKTVVGTTITWEAPAVGEIPITGYKVFFKDEDTIMTQYNGVLDSTARTCIVAGLTTGKTYVFGVKSVNIYGDSSISNVIISNYTWENIPFNTDETWHSGGQALIKFNFQQKTPVYKAMLSFPINSVDYPELFQVHIHKIIKTWGADSVTWSSFVDAIEITPDSSHDVYPGWLYFDVTNLVNEWIANPETNFGLCMICSDSIDNGLAANTSYNNTHKLDQPTLYILSNNTDVDVNKWGYFDFASGGVITHLSIGTEIYGRYVDGASIYWYWGDENNNTEGIFTIDENGFKVHQNIPAEEVVALEYTDDLYMLNYGYARVDDQDESLYITKGTDVDLDGYFTNVLYTTTFDDNFDDSNFDMYISSVDYSGMVHFYILYETGWPSYTMIMMHIYSVNGVWVEEEVLNIEDNLYSTSWMTFITADRGEKYPMVALSYQDKDYQGKPTIIVMSKTGVSWDRLDITAPGSIGAIPERTYSTFGGWGYPLLRGIYIDNNDVMHVAYHFESDNQIIETGIVLDIKDGKIIRDKNITGILHITKDTSGRPMYFLYDSGTTPYDWDATDLVSCRKVVTFDPDQYRE